jgi:hypothetical protein
MVALHPDAILCLAGLARRVEVFVRAPGAEESRSVALVSFRQPPPLNVESGAARMQRLHRSRWAQQCPAAVVILPALLTVSQYAGYRVCAGRRIPGIPPTLPTASIPRRQTRWFAGSG